MKRKILAVICLVAIIFSVFGMPSAAAVTDESEAVTTQETPQIDGMMLVAENSFAALYVDLETANFIVYDKAKGEKWSAVPKKAGTTFSSMIKVTYTSADGVSATVTAPSFESGFSIKKIEDGIKIIFEFSSENTGFSVPVSVKISEGYFDVSIVYSEVEETGESRITDIELLPNMLYGSAKEEGYVFIPDGSGAIINYSDSLSRNENYSARVYGNDPCQDLIFPIITDAKKVHMPVFGAVKGDAALLAVITESDVYATINAAMLDNALTVGSSFIFREHDLTGLQQSGGGERTLDIMQSKPLSLEPNIRFYMLSGKDANYSGMANCYREHLIKTDVLKEKETSATSAVSVMAFGAVPEKKVIFGIPITSVRKATDFSELSSLYTALTENGAEAPSFYLYGFLDGGYGAKTVTKPKYIRKLGGKKGYEEFAKLAGKDNVFTVYNTERSYGRPLDFLRFNDYMSSLNQTTVKVHYRSLSSGLWHKSFGAWSFYTIKYQQKLVSKLLNKLPKESSIVFEHYGEELLSDFTSDAPTGRHVDLNFMQLAMKKASQKGINVAVDGANAYSAGFADEIYDIPLESSGFTIESKSVPFYTMVFHSYKKLSSSPVNFESSPQEYALKAFENGISATYAVSGCDAYELKDTVFNFLYNSKIEDLLPDMKKYIKDYSEIHKTLSTETIVKHEYKGDLSITEYSNGWKIVCNYGETEQTYKNITIAKLDYAVIK